jgi:hypothetical protein
MKNTTLYHAHLFVFACPDCEAPIGTVMLTKFGKPAPQSIPLGCLFCPWSDHLRLDQAVYQHEVNYQDRKCFPSHSPHTREPESR